jgi:hypothetical protein
MTTNLELLKQLMQMKDTLKTLDVLCTAHPENTIIDELKSLRLEIMNNGANYFIDMVEQMDDTDFIFSIEKKKRVTRKKLYYCEQ